MSQMLDLKRCFALSLGLLPHFDYCEGTSFCLIVIAWLFFYNAIACL